MTVLDLINYQGELSISDKALILRALQDDQVIVYPTDTLYGLGVNALSDQAVTNLYLLKEREDAPVSVLVESVDSLLTYAKDLDNKAQEFIRHFLPGPLTVICNSDFQFADKLYSKTGTIGFRVPADSISRQIPRLLGHPISTTSVNPAGRPPATNLSEIRAYYDDKLELILDAGPLSSSAGSTVIDLTTTPFKILREGEISRLVLQEFLN